MAFVSRMLTAHLQKPTMAVLWLLTILLSNSKNFMLLDRGDRNFGNINTMTFVAARSALASLASWIIIGVFSRNTTLVITSRESGGTSRFCCFADVAALGIAFITPRHLLYALLVVIVYAALFSLFVFMVAKGFNFCFQTSEDVPDPDLLLEPQLQSLPNGQAGFVPKTPPHGLQMPNNMTFDGYVTAGLPRKSRDLLSASLTQVNMSKRR